MVSDNPIDGELGGLTIDRMIQRGWPPRVTTSGIASFHGVTGGVYKTRERIHHSIADRRLLAIPPSCRRVAACNPN